MIPRNRIHLRIQTDSRWFRNNPIQRYQNPISILLTLVLLLTNIVFSRGLQASELHSPQLSTLPDQPGSSLVNQGEAPVQLYSNSHGLFGSPSVFSILADPEFVFFQLDVGDGSDLIFSTDPTIPFTYLYPEPGIYEYQLSAFGSLEEPFIITGIHTVSEFITSSWPEPKLNYDDGGLFICDACPDEEDAILDPIYLHNGEFFLVEEDLRIPGRGFDYLFQRTYKSQLSFDGRMGHNWTHNYMQHLIADGLNIVQVSGNGRRDTYTSSDGINFTAPAGFYTSLTRNNDQTYTIRAAHGSQALFNALDGSPAQGRLYQISDRNGNTMRFAYDDGGRLERVIDTLGRPINYIYNMDGRLAYIEDFIGRRVSFTYDLIGDLVAVTGPAVTGTPNGNDFPNGKTWRYTYTSGFGDERLNHNLRTIIAPNEVANGSLTPYLVNTYASTTNPIDYNFDRVIAQQWGGTNASGVPAGGTFTVSYEELNAGEDPTNLSLPRNRTTIIDRNGNQKVYEHNANGHRLTLKEYSNRNLRPSDPEFWETTYRFNRDGQLVQTTHPAGNVIEIRYDETNSNRLQQGNRIAEVHRADPMRRGDQSVITTTYTFEPIYNQVRTVTEPRGNDPMYVPQNGGAASPQRYTTVQSFDYEETCDLAEIGAKIGRTASDVQQLLNNAGMCGTPGGDLNGDVVTNQVAGNVIVTDHPTVNLLSDANLITIEGGTQQPSSERTTYNQYGQPLTATDPEGNVDSYSYYSEQDPNGDGLIDNPNGDPNTGGYLRQTTRDTISSAERNSGTNPPPTAIRTLFSYDPVGNVTREVDGRGIATDYFVNQLNQVVQITRAAGHELVTPSPAEPEPLFDFQYLTRIFYDANSNVVLQQVEDRGNRSQVDGNPPLPDLPPAVPNPDPVGGRAFVDTLYHYDILNNLIEKVEEVGAQGGTPLFLRTHTRYDANENPVLTIWPEGNAASTRFDERDLRLQQTRGATVPPMGVLLSATDPTDYNVRNGLSSIITYHYDHNRNLIESVDAADTDGSAENNSDIAGVGDRTRTIYDGFDRPTSVVDSVGNQTVTQYDPTGNVVRVLSFGPIDGASPTTDGPDQLTMPVSTNNMIQLNNLVNRSLLAATEHSFDERNRLYQVDRVLFVNSISTVRVPDVADGAVDIGKGDLTPNDTQAISDVGGVTILGRVTTRTEYDRNARPIFRVEDDGDITRLFYDGVGRVIQSVDAEGNRAEMAYDDNGNLIETQETDVPQKQGVADETFVITYFYDSLNRLQRSVNNVGETFDYRYDSRDNMVAMADAQGPVNGASIARRAFAGGTLTVNQINDFGNVTMMVYDGLNRKLREDQVLTASGEGDGVNIGADHFGIPTNLPALDPSQGGTDGLISVRYLYDGNSLLTSLTDDNGNQTQYTYDNLNRKLTETKGICVAPAIADQCDPPTTIMLLYDPDDNLVRITDENGSIIDYTHDAINRRIRAEIVRGPDVVGTTVETYTYDGLSRRTRATDNNEPDDAGDDSTITHAYDSLNRVIEETQQIGSQEAKAISTGWRAENLRIGVTYPNGRPLAYTFDKLDRLRTIEEAPVVGTMANLIYLPLIANGSGTVVESTVQAATQSQRQTITATQATPLVQYTYIGRERVLERTLQNKTRMTFLDDDGVADSGYDGERRPVQLRHLTSDNRLLIGFGHSYDRMGNKQHEEKLHAPSESELYTFDSVYRLLQFQRGTLNNAKDAIDTQSTYIPLHSDWTLDGVGNWQLVDNEMRQHSSFNEITERTDGGPIAVRSDNNGNEIDDGTSTFAWDYRNRLRTVKQKVDDTLIARYTYDVAGRRSRKMVSKPDGSSTATEFYYDDWQVIEERTNITASQQTIAQQYVYGGLFIDELLLLDRNLDADEHAAGAGDQRLFYHTNTLFSVFALTDRSGEIREGYHYDAYGQQTVFAPGPDQQVNFGGDDLVTPNGTSLIANPYLFTGRRFDHETGLYFYRARYFDSTQGRFIHRDPIGFRGDMFLNLYTYAMNDPVNWLDPLGHARVKYEGTIYDEDYWYQGPWAVDDEIGSVGIDVDFVVNACTIQSVKASESKSAPTGLQLVQKVTIDPGSTSKCCCNRQKITARCLRVVIQYQIAGPNKKIKEGSKLSWGAKVAAKTPKGVDAEGSISGEHTWGAEFELAGGVYAGNASYQICPNKCTSYTVSDKHTSDPKTTEIEGYDVYVADTKITAE